MFINYMPTTIEQPTFSDGSANPRYVDLLDQDPALAGQKFVCLSFVSPENIIKDKQHFFFEQFLKTYELRTAIEKFTQFLAFVSYKHGLDLAALNTDFESYVLEEKNSLAGSNITEEFKTFSEQNDERLCKHFDQAHEFQTSVRSLKIRGSYGTQEEAEVRAKTLRRMDDAHNILVGEVGTWMPWDPEAYKTGRVEYLEGLQNRLMQEKQKSEVAAKEQFEERVREQKKAAIEENKKRAAETGQILTQDIDDAGNLVPVGPAIGLTTLQAVAGNTFGNASASIEAELMKDNINRKV
jgi:hypothetical protein